MNIFLNLIYSTRSMAVFLVIYALSMAIATFVENDFGTQTAKVLIYEAKWFEILQILLIVNFIGNIGRYNLLRKEKWPLLVFHLSFLVIFIGGAITRYYSYEGLMLIREEQASNKIISEKIYLNTVIQNDSVQKEYVKECIQPVWGWNFNEDYTFLDKEVNIEMLDFVPNAKNQFIKDKNGERYLNVVTTDGESRQNYYLKSGENKVIAEKLVSFNGAVPGGINIIEKEGQLFISTPVDYNYTVMATQERGLGGKDSLQALKLRALYQIEEGSFVFPKPVLKGTASYIPSLTKKEQEINRKDYVKLLISSGDASQEIELLGGKYILGYQGAVILNGLKVSLGYGSRSYTTPFALYLRDFQLDRYPGSNSPSSFASEVTIRDPKNKLNDSMQRIFMNTVLDYGGYRFFQSSYDPDEKGTRLSVNHDNLGTWVTYIGYMLLFIGLFITLFWKGTRFRGLYETFVKLNKNTATVVLLLCSTFLFAQNDEHNHDHDHSDPNHTHEKAQKASKKEKTIPQHIHDTQRVFAFEHPEDKVKKFKFKKDHTEKYNRMLVQDYQGRIKPMHTVGLELLRKIYKGENFHGLNSTEFFMASQLDPQSFSRMPTIIIGGSQTPPEVVKAIKKKLGLPERVDNYAAVIEFFDENTNHILEADVKKAKSRRDADKDAYDKEIVNLDERLWIMWNILNKAYLKIYPKEGDENNTWHFPTDPEARFTGMDSIVLRSSYDIYNAALYDAIKTDNFVMADSMLVMLNQYQAKIANPKVLPSKTHIDVEVFYNNKQIFFKAMIAYFILGFLLLFICFGQIFKQNKKLDLFSNILFILISIVVLVHAVGLGLRWYITGHAPWSNGYEAIVFIAWIVMIAGILFTRKNNRLILAAATIFTPFLLGIAHGNLMSPEITPLVPVLKSYWLMIHVAIITSSYAFFGLSAMLGLLVMLLYIFKTNKNNRVLNIQIKQMTIVNEMSLTIGLFALAIGTFLGGMWANESWGRYWSWDPKEVWAWISVIVYAFVLHMRLVPGLKGAFTYNVASIFSFPSILMTFFGVNYYLSGLHSYAAGDPVKLDTWIYFAALGILILCIVAYFKHKKFKK